MTAISQHAAKFTRRMHNRILAVLALCALTPALGFSDDKPAASAAPKGQRVLICGHSFHVFVGAQIAAVAKAAGINDHVAVGTQSIGGSTVTQHWNLGDPAHPDPKHPDVKNQVKEHLTAGDIDVLTLAPHMRLIPDKAIEDFADMAVAHNPNIRILAQESWMIFDDMKKPIKANTERDGKTVEVLRPPLDEFKNGLEKQAKEINAKLGKQVVFVIPVGDAVLALREKVIKGEVPGFTKQSELFNDPIGHVKPPVQQLEAYCYFAAIYHRSPVGLTSFEKAGDADSHKLNQLLQEIAWKAVTSDPMSGVTESGK
jgi:hypothetical protein